MKQISLISESLDYHKVFKFQRQLLAVLKI